MRPCTSSRAQTHGYVVSLRWAAGFMITVPRLGAPCEPLKLGSGAQPPRSEELGGSCGRVRFWACVCSCKELHSSTPDTERSVRLILLSLLSEHSDTFYPLEGIHTKKRPSLSQGGGIRGSRTSVCKSIGAKRDLSDINVIIEEDGSEDEAPPAV